MKRWEGENGKKLGAGGPSLVMDWCSSEQLQDNYKGWRSEVKQYVAGCRALDMDVWYIVFTTSCRTSDGDT